jgi:hypothetical protein
MRWTWTEKAKKALIILDSQGFDTSRLSPVFDFPRVYREMKKRGFLWENGEWLWVPPVTTFPPSEEVYLRVSGDSTTITEDATKIIDALKGTGYTLIKTSGPFPRRFPRQNDSTIYIQVR